MVATKKQSLNTKSKLERKRCNKQSNYSAALITKAKWIKPVKPFSLIEKNKFFANIDP